MAWVLAFWWCDLFACPVGTMEFNTKEACEAAAADLGEKISGQDTPFAHCKPTRHFRGLPHGCFMSISTS
jgi:hypothetical protein